MTKRKKIVKSKLTHWDIVALQTIADGNVLDWIRIEPGFQLIPTDVRARLLKRRLIERKEFVERSFLHEDGREFRHPVRSLELTNEGCAFLNRILSRDFNVLIEYPSLVLHRGKLSRLELDPKLQELRRYIGKLVAEQNGKKVQRESQ